MDKALVLFVILGCLAVAEACYIRNCPVGGRKRSFTAEVSKPTSAHKCPSCFRGEGICVASQICCSSKFGCQVGGPFSQRCSRENRSRVACEVPGKSCGQSGQGRCAIAGVCCEGDSCTATSECKEKTTSLHDLMRKLFREEQHEFDNRKSEDMK